MSTTSTIQTSIYPIPTITSYTNLGPMPTTITFPPNCRTDVYDFNTDGIGVPYTYYTQGCALSSCCPSSHVYSTAFEWYSNYFSPAVCPYGYTAGPADPIISTASGETVRWCCPTSFQTPNAAGLPTAATTPYDNYFCQRQYYNLSSTAFIYSNIFDQQFISTESINSWYYAAYPFQIRWKSGDFDNIATLISSTSTTSTSPTSTPSQSHTTSTSSPASSTPVNIPTSGIAKGAIVAIVVVVGVFLLAGLAILVWWLRRRSRARAAQSEQQPPPFTASKNEYALAMQEDPHHQSQPGITSLRDTRYGHELDANEQVELDASERVELDAQSRQSRAELR